MLRRLVVAQAEPMCFKIETWHFYLVHLGTNTHPLSIKCVNVKYRNRAAIKLHSSTTGIYAPPNPGFLPRCAPGATLRAFKGM